MFEVQITTNSPEDATRWLPHIAAQVGCSEEELLEYLKTGSGSFTVRMPDPVGYGLSFGGPDALRSIAKSCLVLWALAVGNEQARSEPYAGVRRFITIGDEAFNLSRAHIDSRHVPVAHELKRRYGPLFNLIYVASDASGRVIGHFTLYNVVGWSVVLAESGGTPNTRIALASNPLDPREWSESIPDEIEIDFAWLDSPEYSPAQERFVELHRQYLKAAAPQELSRIADDVFSSMGIFDGNAPLSEKQIWEASLEIGKRAALWNSRKPFEEKITGEAIVEMLKRARRSGNET